ncbi:MAG: extracellular solute-binding protein [Lachnospiraceae bacterium]
MKKIYLLLITMVTLVLCTGCGEKEPKEITTVTLWHYYNADIKTKFDDLVQTFNETEGKEKGIIVDAYSLGGINELADALFSSANKEIGSKKMPDVFAAYSDSALRLDQLGVVASLDSYFSKKEIKQYRPDFIEDGRIGADHALKIVPVAKSTELIFLNETDFHRFSKDTGVEVSALSTWEGIAETAEKYYKWSGGKAFFGMDSLSNYMIIGGKQLGEEVFKIKNGKMTFELSRDGAKKLWDMFYVPYIKGYYTAVGRFRSDDMKSGSIIMYTGSNSSASFFPTMIETGKDTSTKIKPLVLPYPYFTGQEKVCVQQGAGMVVKKSNPKKEKACVAFLKWFTNPKQNAAFAAATSYLPVENQALSYEETLKVLGTTDEADVRVQTSKALFDMLHSYSMYASKPFEYSVDARRILDDSLLKKAQEDVVELKSREKAGESKQELIKSYSGTDNFDYWYLSLIEEFKQLLN